MDLILSPSSGDALENVDVHPQGAAVLAEMSRLHIVIPSFHAFSC